MNKKLEIKWLRGEISRNEKRVKKLRGLIYARHILHIIKLREEGARLVKEAGQGGYGGYSGILKAMEVLSKKEKRLSLLAEKQLKNGEVWIKELIEKEQIEKELTMRVYYLDRQ